MKKVKIKKEKLFRTLSILFLGVLFIIFSSRFTYNFIIENVTTKKSSNQISNILISKINKDNLSYKDNIYTVVGNLNNNYILYSGILFRVMSISNDEIKVISDDSITLLPWGKSKKYEDSNIYNWLNNMMINNLTKNEKLLNELNTCINVTNKSEFTNCNNIKSKISTLSLNDYLQAGANNSFMNNGTYFWLSSTDENNNPWYVFDNGGVNVDTENHIYGIKVVLSLKNFDYIYGNGTKDSPYLVSNDSVDKLSDIELGSYINYSNYTWKVVSKQNDTVKLVLSESLNKDGEIIKKSFSEIKNEFDLNDKTGISYYLNNDFYNSLENNKYIKSNDFYIGKYEKYNLDELEKEKIECKVGLLTLGDNFLTENSGMYLISNINEDITIPLLNKNNTIYYDLISYESEIKPVIYLDNSLEILKGTGNINYPFELRLENE